MAIGLHKYSVQEALAPYFKSEQVINISGTTYAAVDGGASLDTITDSGSDFVTDGWKVGDKFTISGAGDAANHGVHEIAAVAAGTLTLTSASALTADTAGDNWTIKKNMPVSRAIINETNAALAGVVLTLEDGSSLTMSLAVGVIYPIACTACDAALDKVSFLY
jgi:hypothetical protein